MFQVARRGSGANARDRGHAASAAQLLADLAAAIEFVTVSALAPGKTAVTSTCGGTICGYCVIGRSSAATAPPSVMISEMTVEKIGRSMKKCVNTWRYFVGAAGVAGAWFIPSGVLAAQGKPGANDRIALGIVGPGGRGGSLVDWA